MTEKSKKAFDVKIEYLIPTTIVYRVNALDEQDALKEVEKQSARQRSMQHHMRRRIKLKAIVYYPNSTTMKLSKTYRQI